MSRYFIEDVKCGYDTCFDCCGPHTEADLLALGKGHYSDEIEVPILDDEKTWLNR